MTFHVVYLSIEKSNQNLKVLSSNQNLWNWIPTNNNYNNNNNKINN